MARLLNITEPTPTEPVIGLSQSGYSAGENQGVVVLSVLRSGDVTQPATVNYATSDQAGLTPCNVFNALASERCDYATTIGTVRFAAGESSQRISIRLVDDSWAEGTEGFTLSLSNPSGATLGTTSSAAVTITDNETVTCEIGV